MAALTANSWSLPRNGYYCLNETPRLAGHGVNFAWEISITASRAATERQHMTINTTGRVCKLPTGFFRPAPAKGLKPRISSTYAERWLRRKFPVTPPEHIPLIIKLAGIGGGE